MGTTNGPRVMRREVGDAAHQGPQNRVPLVRHSQDEGQSKGYSSTEPQRYGGRAAIISINNMKGEIKTGLFTSSPQQFASAYVNGNCPHQARNTAAQLCNRHTLLRKTKLTAGGTEPRFRTRRPLSLARS